MQGCGSGGEPTNPPRWTDRRRNRAAKSRIAQDNSPEVSVASSRLLPAKAAPRGLSTPTGPNWTPKAAKSSGHSRKNSRLRFWNAQIRRDKLSVTALALRDAQIYPEKRHDAGGRGLNLHLWNRSNSSVEARPASSTPRLHWAKLEVVDDGGEETEETLSRTRRHSSKASAQVLSRPGPARVCGNSLNSRQPQARGRRCFIRNRNQAVARPLRCWGWIRSIAVPCLARFRLSLGTLLGPKPTKLLFGEPHFASPAAACLASPVFP